MPIIKTERVMCDGCGLEIKEDDYITIQYCRGVGRWYCFYLHNTRPEPTITGCGNEALQLLKRMFPHSEHG